MAGIRAQSVKRQTAATPSLIDGQRLSQSEFHRRYEAYPPDVKFELIGGIVYMASPATWSPHGVFDADLNGLFWLYSTGSPGTEVAGNVTAILGKKSEPQPDLVLKILPECGGQTSLNARGYMVGAPELIAEVSHTTAFLDLHQKKDDYERAGVREYIVVWLEKKELLWFELSSGRKLTPDAKGVYRSRAFPGLWIDGPALLARKSKQLIKVLEQGLASPEHARFVKRLETRRRK